MIIEPSIKEVVMATLTGKVAIVSGASKGIGAAVAERLAADGATVIVNYAKSAQEADSVVSRIIANGGRAKAVQADMSKPAEIRRLVEGTVHEFGHVDILVNNAGVYEFVSLTDLDEAHFDRLFDLNVKGLLFATQAAVQAFGERGGSVINISSIASLSPVAGGSVYSATKAAVDALTKSLAAELGGRKILLNSVLPGPVETEGFWAMAGSDQLRERLVPQTPLGRTGQPSEVANVVSFLASEQSGWITGQVIPVTGGLRI
jgi:3-oxoacyl-[acyl-carrier protein] reductase